MANVPSVLEPGAPDPKTLEKQEVQDGSDTQRQPFETEVVSKVRYQVRLKWLLRQHAKHIGERNAAADAAERLADLCESSLGRVGLNAPDELHDLRNLVRAGQKKRTEESVFDSDGEVNELLCCFAHYMLENTSSTESDMWRKGVLQMQGERDKLHEEFDTLDLLPTNLF
eukprot:Trichotokara_eunicae@DN5827_c0_g1_i2.p2